MNDTMQALSHATAARGSDVIGLLEEMVAIATPNPPGDHYEEVASLLHDRLFGVGFQIETLHIPPEALLRYGVDGVSYPRPALVGRYGPPAGRSLHLHGHFDVVPANRPDQYRPKREGGRIYGRGTADMKGGLAALWGAILVLHDLGIEPKHPLTLTLTPDEESGGESGIGHLLREGLVRTDDIDFLIMPECTSGSVWNASKGALVVDVIVEGKAAHSTLPHLGRSAFEDMLPVAEALVELRRRVETRGSRFAVKDPRAGFSTMAIGGEGGGGEKFNIIPGRYHFTVDRRPIPEESLDEVRKELFAVCDHVRAQGIDVRFETWLEAQPSLTEPDEPGCRVLAQALAEVTQRETQFLLCPGFLDIRHFNARGVPCVACGPGRLEVAHGPDEYVSEKDVLDYVRTLALTMMRF